MKHFTLVLLFSSVGFWGTATAQFVAKANPGGLLLGAGSASLELFLNQRFSAQLDGHFMPKNTLNGLPFSGAGVGLSGRFYATASTRPTGLFASATAARHWMTVRDLRTVEHQYAYTALGIHAGYQLTLINMITLEAGAGVWTGINIPQIRQAFGVNEYYGEGANFWLNLGVGVQIWRP